MFNFIINALKFFKDLIKVCITYGCILFCGCLKNKCIDNNNNEEINDEIKSPTPLLNPNIKHPILEAYEEHIINKIKSNDNQ